MYIYIYIYIWQSVQANHDILAKVFEPVDKLVTLETLLTAAEDLAYLLFLILKLCIDFLITIYHYYHLFGDAAHRGRGLDSLNVFSCYLNVLWF